MANCTLYFRISWTSRCMYGVCMVYVENQVDISFSTAYLWVIAVSMDLTMGLILMTIAIAMMVYKCRTEKGTYIYYFVLGTSTLICSPVTSLQVSLCRQ